jgi:DUF971 family protein
MDADDADPINADEVAYQELEGRVCMGGGPRKIDLKKDRGLTVEWEDGSSAFYPVAYLRRMSPSADMRELRQEQERNPLTVLPAGACRTGPLVVEDAELVGNYAIRLRFSDGHHTGIYSWEYLRTLKPAADEADRR